MPRTRVAISATAVAILAIQTVALVQPGATQRVINISNLSQLFASLVATFTAVWVGRSAVTRFERSFWNHMAAAFGAWSFSQIVWTLAESNLVPHLFHNTSITLPLFFFSFAPLLVLVTKRYQEEEGLDWFRLLDSLQIVILLLAAFIWLFYIPYQTETDEQFTHRTLDHVFMFRNVTIWLAFCMRAAVAGTRLERHLFGIASIFTTLYMLATHIPTLARLSADVGTGTWMDVFWTLPYTIIVLLALFWRTPTEKAEGSRPIRAVLSAHITPSLLPIAVLVFSGYMARRFPIVAVAFVVLAFVLYSLRLAVTQFRQEGAKRALADAEHRFRTLFHQNSLPMWVFARATGEILEANYAACEHYGYSRNEFLSRNRSEITDAGVVDLVERTMTSSSVREEKHRTKDGRVFDAAISRVSIEFGGRDAELVTVQDLSERKKLEQQLRQAQKMEAVGTLAGGIAHDFNNLLTIITGYSQVILERAGTDEQLRREMQQIEVASNKAIALIRQLLAFSRRQLLQPQVVNLEGVVTGVEKMLRRLIGENIELIVRTTGAVGAVKADPGQLEQVLINLAVNARDAMEARNGGRLTFELQNIDLDEQFAADNVGAIAGRYVMLAVTDTGSGMSKEVQARIFEPFFTTKASSGGSGLGLATVYGIVQQSGGYITVSSVEGRGTTFRIFLPRTSEQATPLEGVPELRSENTGTETILLVEDDDGLRALTRRVLLKHGYEVIETARTSDAEQACRNHPGKIHMLLTDVVMPGASGKELASRLTMIRPEMLVLYMSGYTDSVVMKQGVEEGSVNFLAKPFTPAALGQKVREVLDIKYGRANVARPYLRG
jgi:PAS domain S-box-containing protein